MKVYWEEVYFMTPSSRWVNDAYWAGVSIVRS
jgi:hypothetical protein